MRPEEPEGLRILALLADDPTGGGYGTSRYAAELHRALGSLHHTVAVASPMVRDEVEPPSGVAWQRPSMPLPVRHPDPTGQVVLDACEMTAAALRAVRAGFAPDLILAYGWGTAQAGEALRGVTGAPLMAVLHDTVAGRFAGGEMTPPLKYAAELEAWLISRASAVVVPSRALADEVVRGGSGLPPVHVVVPGARREVPRRPVNVADFRAMFARPGEPLVLFVGRLAAENGVGLLPAMLLALRRRHPQARLVVAGEGPSGAELERSIRSASDLSSAVRFVGHVTGAPMGALLDVADVLVLPSRYAPMRLAAIDGVAAGLPVVLSDLPGPLEPLAGVPKELVHVVPGVEPVKWAAAVAAAIEGPRRADPPAMPTSWVKAARVLVRRAAAHLQRGRTDDHGI